MSELKTRFIDDTYSEYFNTGNHELAQIYLKSEADKVIKELKAQKAQAEDDCAYWKTMAQKNAADNAVMAKQRAEALKRERHNKYKRCLTMAKWCDESEQGFELLGNVEYDAKCRSHLYFVSNNRKKWRKRWLELAEQFKE